MKVLAYFSIALVQGWSLTTMPLASAATPQQILATYETEARNGDPNFKPGASRGEALFRLERNNTKGELVSCTTCHTQDPKAVGKTRAHKKIKPLAPVANPERFTDPKKVAKWFRRNCKDVLERECTAAEKADFIVFLMSVR